ncbi:MAG: hypothetical protein PVF58_00310 [Candidatus Methanofastidiosia archaeon]|jgi:hypothetical protein
MKKYVPLLLVLFLGLGGYTTIQSITSQSATIQSKNSQNASHTTITLQPDIGENIMYVTQEYTLTEPGLTTIEIITVSLSYADLTIYDKKNTLDYTIRDNIIIGKRMYRTITIFFKEPLSSEYTFTVHYWYPTTATGKPLTGKYQYTILNITDTTTLQFDIPLTNITLTSRSHPTPSVTRKEDSTIFSYTFSEDTTIVLAYEPTTGIDYSNTKTATFSQNGYTFDVTYPAQADIFLEDIQFFIESVFPVYLEKTGTPLRFDSVSIVLDKEEDTWAAAEYKGNGNIRVLVNNSASYPSQFLAHELTHSYIGDFSRYLEEGIANYFERQANNPFFPSPPDNYIPNTLPFFAVYENQFNETVDITYQRYGLGITERHEALIYAKYSKGTNAIYEIAHTCGHETVQEMLAILKDNRDCDPNFLIYELTQGDTVYAILKKYGFDIVPPHAYPAERALNTLCTQSWWGYILCVASRFKSKIRETPVEDIPELTEAIEKRGKFASETTLLANILLFGVCLVAGITIARKVYNAGKRDSKVLVYFYLIPVVVGLVFFSYFLYEFLFNGYKLRWILKNVVLPWGWGIMAGVVIIVMVEEVVARVNIKGSIETVWALLFFVLGIGGTYFLGLWGVLLALGYVVSLAVLFTMRRK